MRWAALFLASALFLCASCEHRHPGARERIRLKDHAGNTVLLPALPRRIVSLAPSITEIVYALDADSLLCGVSSYCNHPPECASKPKVGNLLTPSVEAITALAPDLVLITAEGNSKATHRQLEELGIPVFVLNPGSFAGVLRSIESIGAVTGSRQRAARLTDSLAASFTRDTALKALPPPTILFVLSTQPLIAAGKLTFLGEMIDKAGGKNAVNSTSELYPVLNRESVIENAPDIILVPSDMQMSVDALLATFPEWKNLPAFRTGDVHIVEADVFQRPGPRLWTGLNRLQGLIVRWKAKQN